MQERTATVRGGQRPGSVEYGGPVGERSEQPPRLFRPAERDERLDLVGNEPRVARVVGPVGGQAGADRLEVAVRDSRVAVRQRAEAQECVGEPQRAGRTDRRRERGGVGAGGPRSIETSLAGGDAPAADSRNAGYSRRRRAP